MDYYVSTATDVGTRKEVNQDAVFVRRLVTPVGKMAFAVLCDGMGGLQYGEIASTEVVAGFRDWMYQRLPVLLNEGPLEDYRIRDEWGHIIIEKHEYLRQLGEQYGCRMGTTAVVLLLTESRYYLLNIGDSRAYVVEQGRVHQLTEDHTAVMREIALGNLTPEQAEQSPIRHILTRCVGVGEYQPPDMSFGMPAPGALFLLCSDGFRHCISRDELYSALYNPQWKGASELTERCTQLIELNKQRGETDNISVAAVYCFLNQNAQVEETAGGAQ